GPQCAVSDAQRRGPGLLPWCASLPSHRQSRNVGEVAERNPLDAANALAAQQYIIRFRFLCDDGDHAKAAIIRRVRIIGPSDPNHADATVWYSADATHPQ